MKQLTTIPRKRPRGLALIEVLICATIASMMLTATAVTFRASVGAYRDNSDRNMLMSHGRIAMRQIIDEIRQGDRHQPLNDTAYPNAQDVFKAGLATEYDSIEITKTRKDASEKDIDSNDPSTYVTLTWQFDPVKRCLTRTRTVGGSNPTTTTIALYVQDFKIRMEPSRSAAHVLAGNPDFDLLLRAVVTITLQNVDGTGHMQFSQGSGQVVERIIDAAVPRKNYSGL
jgi:hypothetical protein